MPFRGLVGFTLGLFGGGGSILAVPLMVYVQPPRRGDAAWPDRGMGTRAQIFEAPNQAYTKALIAAVPVTDPSRVRPNTATVTSRTLVLV